MDDKFKSFDRFLNPKTVAVVGAKKLNDYFWLRNVSTFKGNTYSVNIDPTEFEGIEALGFKNYLSLNDIPGKVDYVIVSVPREVAPFILKDCVKKKVGGVTLFTSGFSETGTPEGRKLEATVKQIAGDGGLKMVGPNCMGVFNPGRGLRNFESQYHGESGPVGFLSQSGTHGINFSVVGYVNGIKISKMISYGNAVILDNPDYLEYLLQDDQTKIIGMYVEGLKDGRRFFDLLKKTAKQKPVVIWKGGATKAGQRATMSHTGSLAESSAIWDVVIKQCNAIKAESLEEMVDAVKTLIYCRPVKGYRVGLVSMTGGQSVVITDSFSKAGLEVPLLSAGSYKKLSSFFNIIGGSYKNPIDMGQNWVAGENTETVLNIMDEDQNIDSIIMELSVNFLHRRFKAEPSFEDKFFGMVAQFRKTTRKPLLAILSSSYLDDYSARLRERLFKVEIPAYPSFERGAKALKNFVDHCKRRPNSTGK